MRRLFCRLRRITSSGQYIAEIDGVRFVAFAMVFALHLHQRVLRQFDGDTSLVESSGLHGVLGSCGIGVSLFFALSGYILHRILSRPLRLGESLSMKRYFLRRLTRLEPPYIVVTTLLCLVIAFTGYRTGGHFLGDSRHSSLITYAATFLYAHTLLFGRPPSCNPPGWSLEVEVHFYLLAPLLALALNQLRRLATRAALLAAVIVIWPFLFRDALLLESPWRFTLVFGFPFFLVGVLVHEMLEYIPSGATAWKAACDVMAICGLGMLFLFNGGKLGLPAAAVMQCLGIGLFLVGVLRGGAVPRMLRIPFVAAMGGMCYTLYLIHLPITEVMAALTVKLLPEMTYWSCLLIELAIILPLVLLVGAILYLLLEQPCMRKDWPAALWAWSQRFISLPSARRLAPSDPQPNVLRRDANV